MLPVKIGVIVGAAIPAGLGALDIVRDQLRPDQPACGMPVLGAWFLLLFGTPIGALVGASAGVIWALVWGEIRRSGR